MEFTWFGKFSQLMWCFRWIGEIYSMPKLPLHLHLSENQWAAVAMALWIVVARFFAETAMKTRIWLFFCIVKGKSAEQGSLPWIHRSSFNKFNRGALIFDWKTVFLICLTTINASKNVFDFANFTIGEWCICQKFVVVDCTMFWLLFKRSRIRFRKAGVSRPFSQLAGCSFIITMIWSLSHERWQPWLSFALVAKPANLNLLLLEQVRQSSDAKMKKYNYSAT